MEPGEVHHLGHEEGKYDAEDYSEASAEHRAEAAFFGWKGAHGHRDDNGIVAREDDVTNDDVNDSEDELEVYS